MKTARNMLILIVIIFLGYFGYNYFLPNKSQPKTSENKIESPVVTLTPSTKLLSYSDTSGFRFQYPDDVKIATLSAGPNDYTSIKLTSQIAKGNISIKVSDSNYNNLTAWVKQNAKSENVIDTTLADMPGKKYENKTGQNIIALDSGDVLFSITADYQDGKNYWSKVMSQISSSFTVAPPQDNSSASNSAGSDSGITDEGEEVVE